LCTESSVILCIKCIGIQYNGHKYDTYMFCKKYANGQSANRIHWRIPRQYGTHSVTEYTCYLYYLYYGPFYTFLAPSNMAPSNMAPSTPSWPLLCNMAPSTPSWPLYYGPSTPSWPLHFLIIAFFKNAKLSCCLF